MPTPAPARVPLAPLNHCPSRYQQPPRVPLLWSPREGQSTHIPRHIHTHTHTHMSCCMYRTSDHRTQGTPETDAEPPPPPPPPAPPLPAATRCRTYSQRVSPWVRRSPATLSHLHKNVLPTSVYSVYSRVVNSFGCVEHPRSTLWLAPKETEAQARDKNEKHAGASGRGYRE